jgi:ubiquinone biosynthesis protein UbiJ
VAAAALGRVGVAQAVPALLAALRDAHWYGRWVAARALGRVGDAQAVPALLEALRGSDVRVRGAAARALGQVGDAQVVPALIEALRDTFRYVRRAAAEALGQVGDAQVVPALIEALRDTFRYVRQAAARALGQIAGRLDELAFLKRSARTLWWQLTDREEVAEAVWHALEQACQRLATVTAASLPAEDLLVIPSPPLRSGCGWRVWGVLGAAALVVGLLFLEISGNVLANLLSARLEGYLPGGGWTLLGLLGLALLIAGGAAWLQRGRSRGEG